jgi:hypothetical protein
MEAQQVTTPRNGIHENARTHRNTHRKEGKYTVHSCGKEEFCLPTKLHAPSLADRLIGHVVSHAQRLRLIRAR